MTGPEARPSGRVAAEKGPVTRNGGRHLAQRDLLVERDGTPAGVQDGGSVEAAERLLAELPPTPAVWCSQLRKRYRRRTAVDGVSFTVDRGEVVGLLGPNGAGKTTIIKILLGLVRPDGGEVQLLGRPAGDPRSRARVGYLPELFRYQPWLTAAEVLTLHVRLAGTQVPPRQRQECLAAVGLADRAEDRVGGFSKGMQQRLGLAVALVARPELVVLDEPTSALDPLGRADVRDLLLSLKARGVAVLLNSHLIGEVERVCDRVVILDSGRVAAAGTLADLLGQGELRLRLDGVDERARDRLAAAGALTQEGNLFTVRLLDTEPTAVPELVADLVGLGVRVHAVEPGRVSLEERLLAILRAGGDR
ncbi:ABC transporter ATP-binding protein [Micromonospora sp. NPDC047134]|uniref:ABC transporter ATP-binding protein n=1 Tax=Micromonospora sp. NPDC047134 TaxID=3154340 RepID=UPI0034022DE6